MKIISVVGARPNFMKIAPIIREFKKRKKIKNILVHTGQHYSQKMSQLFFDELKIPKPDINLGIGSGSHAYQTSRMMQAFERILLKQRPDWVIVVGDVNSTLACSITATKLHIPVAHVEAGLRSFDRSMPEEINRLVTDSISEILFTTCHDANHNLKNEGISSRKIFHVGNVMIDTLVANLRKAKQSKILKKLNLQGSQFALVTLHRPSNVDVKENFKKIIKAFSQIKKKNKK